MLEINKVYNGDCFELIMSIDDNSIDLILTDPPFNITARNSWESAWPLDKMWESYNRILKPCGVVAIHAMQPFTSKVVMSNIENFRYEWIWEKTQGTGFLNAKKQPLRNHESILIFYRRPPTYNPQMRVGFKPYTCKQGYHTSNYNDRGAATKEVITVNNGERYPLTVLKFERDSNKYHPTQKPVGLLEYMIKTYTNESATILDNTCGSGSTCLAAKNTNRKFIGIEKNEKFFNIAKTRLAGSDI